MHILKPKGLDFMSLCSKQIGNGNDTNFWTDIWKGDSLLYVLFPRMYALELEKQISVASKLASQMDSSFYRTVRGGIELAQFNALVSFIGLTSLSPSSDRWVCNISRDGNFRVKDFRNFIDDLVLSSSPEPTRWVKSIPIKINIFMWRARRDCLSTRANLTRRGVIMES
nr:RNA-directed DNA polymerase, eukaryota, reverse transcriptase zinc-binding domain protein [Tanacetum cinerariifolium]